MGDKHDLRQLKEVYRPEAWLIQSAIIPQLWGNYLELWRATSDGRMYDFTIYLKWAPNMSCSITIKTFVALDMW